MTRCLCLCVTIYDNTGKIKIKEKKTHRENTELDKKLDILLNELVDAVVQEMDTISKMDRS